MTKNEYTQNKKKIKIKTSINSKKKLKLKKIIK